MIALIAATPLETGRLRAALNACGELPGGFSLCRGTLHGQPVVLVSSGVGKANAAAATALLLSQAKPQVVISFGCGGAFPDQGLGVGDLALATVDIHGDEGVETTQGFLDLRDLGFTLVHGAAGDHFNRIPVSDPWLKRARASLSVTAARRRCRWQAGPFVTVSTCSGSAARSAALAERWQGLCETMEGAAVAQMCAAFDVPFLGLRGISNLTGERDPGAWDLPLAVDAAQEAILDLLQCLAAEDPAR
ncbi:futalosine hydrolase [Geoalkalibacter sp.]|uniref:futalosine hydrolase n=1 Tax=Geoalkalibacter sp. TaxID=3041440 RepID=UPI00272E6DDF|nr:futalosine hydrolase [Geoalkalibacter sp.]